MEHESIIEQRVMRQVRAARVARAALSREALALVVSVAALWGIGREVWVARVFQNAPSLADFSAFARFWLVAFADTRMLVQVLALATVISMAYLVREAARMLSRPVLAFS